MLVCGIFEKYKVKVDEKLASVLFVVVFYFFQLNFKNFQNVLVTNIEAAIISGHTTANTLFFLGIKKQKNKNEQ